MNGKNIYITKTDVIKLRNLLKNGHKPADCLIMNKLKGALDCAKVVESSGVLEDVITMNSRLTLKNIDTGEKVTCWLVFPEKADPSKNMISVLDALGAAMLGHREGDIFEGELSSRAGRLEIVEVIYQPERMGNYIL